MVPSLPYRPSGDRRGGGRQPVCRRRSSVTTASVQRQRECERRAVPNLAPHPDSATMKLDELPGEGQPDPVLPFLSRRPLPDSSNNRLLIAGAIPFACIRYGTSATSPSIRPAYVDPSPLGGEFSAWR